MGHTDICELLLAAGANIEQKEQVNIYSRLIRKYFKDGIGYYRIIF